MLQFIAENSDRLTIAQQAKLAIEGGCAWVQLHLPNADDSKKREITSEIAKMCREAGAILTVEDNIELTKELGLHGVHISDASANARQIRQELGGEAIIGINVTSAQGVPTLAKLDIDYVTISPKLSIEQAKEIIDTVRSVGCNIPIVLTGDFDCLDIAVIRATGASGVATGKKIMAAANPAEATAQLITALMQ